MPKEHEDVEATLEQGTTPDTSQKEKWRAIDWIAGGTVIAEVLWGLWWLVTQVFSWCSWTPPVNAEHFAQFYCGVGLGILSFGYLILILWPIIFKQGKGSKQDNDPRWFHARILSSGIVGGSYAFLLPVVMSLPEGSVNSGGAAALRQAILLATGGLIALIALGETRRKNDNDREAAENLRVHQENMLIQQKEQFEANAFKERKAERRERYTKAIEQLGDEKSSVRMGGVYTLVGLVDEWLEEESIRKYEDRLKEGQVIINNLCAYIRSPFTLATRYDELEDKDSPTSDGVYKDNQQEFYKDKADFKAEADVRLGIIKEIHDRLKSPGGKDPGAWSDFEYDFSGSIFFYPVDLTTSYYKEPVTFRDSTYQGRAYFGGSIYQGRADFRNSTYQSEAVFSGSTYEQGVIFSTSNSPSTYQGQTDFSGSIYQDWADFSDSTYQGRADFRNSTYKGEADFSDSTYQGQADFGGSTYQDWADFSDSTYQGRADFRNSTYKGEADFRNSTYQSQAYFRNSTYKGEADFGGSNHLGRAYFGGSTYQGQADFRNSTYQGLANFSGSTYEGEAYFGGSTYQDWADFSGSTHKKDVTFSTPFSRSIYLGRAYFGGSIYLGQADFGGSTYEKDVTFSTSNIDSTYSNRKGFLFSTSNFRSIYLGRANFSGSIYLGWANFSDSTYNDVADFSRSIFYQETYFGEDGDNNSFSRFTDCTPQFYNEKSHQNTLFGSSDNDFTVDINEGYPINLNSKVLPLGCNFLTTEQKEYLADIFQEIEKINNKLLKAKDDGEKAKFLDTLRSLSEGLHTWRKEATTVKAEDVAAENTES